MEDIIGYAVAFGAIYMAYRYFTGGGEAPSGTPAPAATLGFTPKRVTPEMITQVQSMFPDIPHDNIKYELLRTGSVELTCNKILEHGFLPPPSPQYYTLYPTQPLANPRAPTRAAPAPTAGKPTPAKTTLIDKFQLQERITKTPDAPIPESAFESKDNGKATWEATAAQREASLKERKAQMVLAARQRLLAQQKKDTSSA